MNRYILIQLIIIGIALSCDSAKKLQHYREAHYKIDSIVKLSGTIIFNRKTIEHKFYFKGIFENQDTLTFIKNLTRSAGDYTFIQPQDVARMNIYNRFIRGSEDSINQYLTDINNTRGTTWLAVRDENFIVFKDSNGKCFITFENWKPQIERLSKKESDTRNFLDK